MLFQCRWWEGVVFVLVLMQVLFMEFREMVVNGLFVVSRPQIDTSQ